MFVLNRGRCAPRNDSMDNPEDPESWAAVGPSGKAALKP